MDSVDRHVSIRAPARGATHGGLADGRLGSKFRSALPRGERHSRAADCQDLIVVSIRAPARGATASVRRSAVAYRFRSALPRGERPASSGTSCCSWHVFRSALPRGERRLRLRANRRVMTFRSALPRGERPLVPSVLALTSACFDPRSRAGSDSAQARRRRREHVSIRAPARGATRCAGSDAARSQGVSIRAPARGATTSHAVPTGHGVSIRAPARGATSLPVGSVRLASCFDPRSRAGSDVRLSSRAAWHAFRSALPRGERRQSTAGRLAVSRVSIRAPARGATSRRRTLVDRTAGFDPRSRAGSDATARRTGACDVSIRAPARGATAAADGR